MDDLMANSDLHKFLRTGRSYKIVKRQIVQSSEDRQVINLVINGYIKRYMIANDGSIGVQITYGAGDVFPLTLAYKTFYNQSIYKGQETFYYEAMSNAQVFTVDSDALEAEMKKNQKLYSDFFQEAGKHLESCIQRLENIALKSSYKRVAHQLLYFAQRFGKATPKGIIIETPLTHQDLADILSLTRETVSTSMVELRRKKLIATDSSIMIPDIVKLQEEAYV